MCSRFDALVEAGRLREKQDEEEKQNKKFLFFFRNPNWGSSPSSSSLLHKDYKVMEMETPQNSTSPDSCLTQNKGHMRPAVSHGGRDGGSKKATERETPGWLVEMIKDMNGENPTFIFEKELTTTDVNPSQSRLLIPLKGLKRNDFLTPEELSTIEEYENKKKNKKKGVEVIVVTSMLRTWNLSLKTWDMTKPNYSLTSGWNKVVEENGLKEGVNIGLWSFRSNGTLCFGLGRLP